MFFIYIFNPSAPIQASGILVEAGPLQFQKMKTLPDTIIELKSFTRYVIELEENLLQLY